MNVMMFVDSKEEEEGTACVGASLTCVVAQRECGVLEIRGP